MKKIHLILIYVAFILMFWLAIILAIFLGRSDEEWRDGGWFLALIIFAQLVFYIMVPILLFVIAMVILKTDNNDTELPGEKPGGKPREKPRSERTTQTKPRQTQSVEEYYADEKINCPTCRKWILRNVRRCPFCNTRVKNMDKIRQVRKQLSEGGITEEQYERIMENLKE